MSHFTVLVVLPKEGLEQFEGANEHTGDKEYKNAYNHQWFHPQLEEALAPYNEQPERDSEYLEKDMQFDELGTEVWRAFADRNWTELARLSNERKNVMEDYHRRVKVYDVKGGRNYNESEIATKLKPIDELYQLMATEKFSMDNDDHEDLFKTIYCESGEIFLDKQTKEIYNVWYSNPYAKWDWWVVGGRWRDMGDNGLISDLNVFLETKEIPYWKEGLGYFKLNEIEKELGIEREDYTEKEYDKIITEYLEDENNKIVELWDTSEGTGDKAKPKSYYNNKDLLTMVSRRKEDTWAMLFPEEGWIEAGEMGWFGMSSLDSLSLGETEEAIQDQFALTDNLIEKYKDTHIGLVVDCHI